MAMFPQFGAVPGAPVATGSQALLSFKAGKMEVKEKGGDKFHVSPDLRKGTISLFKGPDDQLMHFSWKERPSGNVVDDIIILPEEAVYKKIDTGREGERVYLMEIAGNRRLFYWMQEKDADKDEENMKKVNELTNSPPPDDPPSSARGAAGGSDIMDLLGSMGADAGAPGGGSTGGPSGDQLNIQSLQSILQNMGFTPQDQGQVASAPITTTATSSGSSSSTPLGAPVPPVTSTPAAASAAAALAAPTPTPGTSSISATAATAATAAGEAATSAGGGGSGLGGGTRLTATDLQRAMMNISGMSPQIPRQPPVSLIDVVDSDVIEDSGMLDDPDVQQALIPLLAPGQENLEELREIIRSPQLQQALSSLSNALQTDNYSNVMSSFQLDPSNPRSASAMARGDPIESLLEALIHAAAVKEERKAAEAAAKREAGEGEGEDKTT